MKELDHCMLCPRACGVDRNAGELGYCRSDAGYHIASVSIHRGEEPVISGEKGICNIFFTRCNLQCTYCQNYQISRRFDPVGESRMTLNDTIHAVKQCLDQGVKAVGFVSPTHFVPHVRAIIENLNEQGYYPVIVYNSNGYDSVETLKSLEGIIDVYIPDFKYFDQLISSKYSDAADYPEVARRAMAEIYRQKGSTVVVDDSGQAITGMIIRHLVLPGQAEDSIAILNWIAAELSPSVYVSLMSQYYPVACVADHPLLKRKITENEYKKVVQVMEDLEICNGWIQELSSSDNYQPDFMKDQPFGEHIIP